jgi:uncharacterized protein YegP (UPF0339 family)
MRATVYPGKDGWRWNVKGLNNEILCSGEAYVRREDAEQVLELLFGNKIPLDVVVRNHGNEVASTYQLWSGHRINLDEVYTEDTNAWGDYPDYDAGEKDAEP